MFIYYLFTIYNLIIYTFRVVDIRIQFASLDCEGTELRTI